MNVLISACLAGIACRYNGKAATCLLPSELISCHTLIPFCPEVCAGLPTPRDAVELLAGKAVSVEGKDLTASFQAGVKKGLALYQAHDCRAAILKSNSPSCGYGRIYDGTFTGRLVAGSGLFAAALAAHTIPIFNETQLSECLSFLNSLSV